MPGKSEEEQLVVEDDFENAVIVEDDFENAVESNDSVISEVDGSGVGEGVPEVEELQDCQWMACTVYRKEGQRHSRKGATAVPYYDLGTLYSISLDLRPLQDVSCTIFSTVHIV